MFYSLQYPKFENMKKNITEIRGKTTKALSSFAVSFLTTSNFTLRNHLKIVVHMWFFGDKLIIKGNCGERMFDEPLLIKLINQASAVVSD